jgi:formylglycine-generating enzyme required for sulfatase activity
MDECAVSNAQFATFCKDTGYVTEAERMGVSPVFHLAVEADPADVLHRLDTTPWWVAVRGADCYRYRVAARSANTAGSATAILGFRCVRDM